MPHDYRYDIERMHEKFVKDVKWMRRGDIGLLVLIVITVMLCCSSLCIAYAKGKWFWVVLEIVLIFINVWNGVETFDRFLGYKGMLERENKCYQDIKFCIRRIDELLEENENDGNEES